MKSIISEAVGVASLSLSGNRQHSKFIEGRIVEAVKAAQTNGATTEQLKVVIEAARKKAKSEL